mgnify:FL=1
MNYIFIQSVAPGILFLWQQGRIETSLSLRKIHLRAHRKVTWKNNYKHVKGQKKSAD